MSFDVASALHQLFAAHTASTRAAENGVWITGSQLNVSAEIVRTEEYPNGRLVQLDIRAKSHLLANRVLIESFGGWGIDETEAAKQAFGKFVRSSFHVLLSSLVNPGPGVDDQVEWETWDAGGGTRWHVCMGPVLLQQSTPGTLNYEDLFDRLKEELLPVVDLSYHWVRVYCMRKGHDVIGSEALLDNLAWPEGRKVVDAWSWPDGEYSATLPCTLSQQRPFWCASSGLSRDGHASNYAVSPGWPG